MVKFSLFVVIEVSDWAFAMIAELAGIMWAVSNGSRDLPNAAAPRSKSPVVTHNSTSRP
jgi:hypothetical protein